MKGEEEEAVKKWRCGLSICTWIDPVSIPDRSRTIQASILDRSAIGGFLPSLGGKGDGEIKFGVKD
jgi:hypothetical protein